MTTTVQVGDPDPTVEQDRITDYCWAPHRIPGRTFTGYCSWALDHDGDHVAADIKGGRAYVAAVWSDADPPAGRVWSPRDRRPWVMGAGPMLLSDGAWTDAMAREGANTGVNRQCSIGWHGECSDPDGERCRCACHADEEDGRL